MEARKKRILVMSAVNFFKGIVFGMVNIVPGISGATIAVVMGIYEGMVSHLNDAFKGRKQFVAAVLYLLPIAAGAVIGALGFSRLVSYCLERFSLPTNIFFAGLIIGTLPGLIFILYPELKNKGSKEEKAPAGGEGLTDGAKAESRGFKAWHIAPFAVSAALIVSLALLVPRSGGVTALEPWQYALLPLVGFASAVIMMIPGVSGVFFLMLIGWYDVILQAMNPAALDFAVIGLFGAGAFIGILAAARVIDFLFRRAKAATYLAVIGLVTGCIASIFIWRSTYETGNGPAGIAVGVVLGIIGAATALLLSRAPKGKVKSGETLDGSADSAAESGAGPGEEVNPFEGGGQGQ